MHSGRRQSRANVDAVEGEQPGDAQLFERIGALPEEGTQLHARVPQGQDGTSPRRPQPTAPVNSPVDVLARAHGVLPQTGEPGPVHSRESRSEAGGALPLRLIPRRTDDERIVQAGLTGGRAHIPRVGEQVGELVPRGHRPSRLISRVRRTRPCSPASLAHQRP